MADETVRLKIVVDEDTKGAKKAAKAVDEVTESTEHLGDALKETGREARNLDQELASLEHQRRDIARRLIDDDDKQLMRQRSAINRRIGLLKALRKEAGDAADSLGSAVSAAGKTSGGASSAAGPEIKLLLLGGAAAAATTLVPFLGAAIAGAVTGTVATGGIVGGLVAASKSSDVKAGLSDLGQSISAEFFHAGDAFVGPFLDAIGIVKQGFANLHLGEVLAPLAPSVTTLAKGLMSLVGNAMPGLERAFARSGPYVEVLAEGLGHIGFALGEFFDEISSSPGALVAFAQLLDVVAGAVSQLGRGLNWLSDVWLSMNHLMIDGAETLAVVLKGLGQDEAAAMWAGIAQRLRSYSDGLPDAIEGTDSFAGSARGAAGAASGLANALQKANDAFDAYFGVTKSLDETKIAVAKGWLELRKVLQENKGEWAANTEAGLANREALLRQVEILKQRRDAEIAASDGSDEAVRKINANYDKQIEKLKTLALQAGATKDVVQDLAGEYKITFWVETKKGQQAVAWSDIHNAERQGKTVTSHPNYPSIPAFAGGGDTPAFQPFRVHSGEMLWSSRQHFVSTAAQTAALAGGSAGASVRPVVISGDGFGAMAFNALVREIQARGGTLAVIGIKE